MVLWNRSSVVSTRPTDSPAYAKRRHDRGCIWMFLNGVTDKVFRIRGTASNCFGGVRSALFCLPVQLLRSSSCRIDDAFNLSFRIVSHASDAFLHFASYGLCRAHYAILIHFRSSV